MITAHPVALDSDDHRFPRGTANDDTHHPRFVLACEQLFGRKVAHLDLGCAGGGLVRDFLDRGNVSYGIDGSDYSQKRGRAEWGWIPGHLFTADITKPFRLPRLFDVITAWEVLEHIREDALPGVFRNVVKHLATGSCFVASVAMFEDRDPATGAVWHMTVKPREWWEMRLAEAGLMPIIGPFDLADYVRGSGNGPQDWNAATRPDLGFHVVAQRFRR